MDTPYLTRKTCQRRYNHAVALWLTSALLFVVGVSFQWLALALIAGAIKLAVAGPAVGEATYWFQFNSALRKPGSLLDPLSPTLSADARLPLYRYRLTGGSIVVAFILSVSLPLAQISGDRFKLILCLPPFLGFLWAVHGYRKALALSRSTVGKSGNVVSDKLRGYSLEEVRQEIRRR